MVRSVPAAGAIANEPEVDMQITCANCGSSVEIVGPPGTSGECTCGNTLTVPSQPVKEQFGVARCTNCWKRYGVVGRPAGTRFKCKACGQIIAIREPGQKAAAAPSAAAPSAAAPSAAPRKGVSRVRKKAQLKKKNVSQLAETQDMDAIPLASPGKAAAAQRPAVAPRPSAGSARQAAELSGLRATVQKLKVAAAKNAAVARDARGQIEEKEHQLEEKTTEIARQAEEISTLQERNTRQSTEISTLQSDLQARSQEADQFKSRVAELDADVKAREAQLAARDAKIHGLETELQARATREETDKFYSEKEDIEKRLEDGGAKLSAMKEALGKLHEPLAETLKRFNEMGAEAGSIDLPDFSEELKKARQEGDEKGAILLDVKKALDEELAAKNGLEAERERLREEISTMRKSHEEFVRAAEEEIDSLATSAAAAEEQKGFLHGLFGGKRGSDTAERAKSSRMKLKAAAALPGEPRIIEDAVEVEDAMPLEEVGGVEDATLAEEAEPIDFAAFDVPAPENLADDDVEIAEAEDAEDAVEVDEVEEGEEAGPAKKPRRARKPTKPAKGGKAERAPKKRRKR